MAEAADVAPAHADGEDGEQGNARRESLREGGNWFLGFYAQSS